MILFIVVYVSWFTSEVFLSVFRRSSEVVKHKADKGTLALIWTIVILANFLSYMVSRWVPWEISENENIRHVGLICIVAGVILRFLIVNSLGKFFTVNVVITEDHKLKTNGFYRHLRHPSYAASLLSFAGYGISLNNWISLILVTTCVATAFLIRIRTEEETLIKHFGNEYLEYQKRTKRLIPFVY